MKTYLIHPGLVPETRARQSLSGLRLRLGVLAVLMLVLSVFLFSGPLLRLLDPVAAVVDIGALSLVLLGLLAGLCFVTVSRWLLGLLWPVFREFNQHHFEPIFKSLRPWQKIVIYLSCYFLLLSVFVACLWAVC